MKKKRIWAVVLACLLIFLISIPALAEEGPDGYADVSPSGDEDTPDDPPPPEEPPEDPPSSEDPSSEPGGDDPSSEPGGDDPSSEPGGDDPSSEPGGDSSIGPSGDDPDDEPWTPPDDGGDNTWTIGGDTGGSSSTPARVPGGTGGTIQQPSFSPSAATPSPSPSPTPLPSSGEPNYKTFAKLTQKNNSMSVVLFYGGAGFVGVGSLGLITLLVFIVRGRRSADDRDGIFEEIHEAENRRPARIPAGRTQAPRSQPVQPPQEYESGPAYEAEYVPGYEERPPVLHRPEPEALSVPINGSMYTEEFELPPQPVRQTPPPAAAMYTEEFALPEEMAQPPAPAPRPEPARPTPQQPSPQVSGDTRQYDTTELLREILHGDSDK